MKRNVLLIAITALLLVLGILGCAAVSRREQGSIAVISQNGQELYRIDLTSVTTPYTITVEGEHGAENVILLENGAISMQSASCPDKLCVKRGVIRTSGIPLVCLPNHIIIEIIGDAPHFDGIVY